MTSQRRSSDIEPSSAKDDLDPFADEPIAPPRPVSALHVVVPVAATVMLGLGLTGIATALSTGAAALSLSSGETYLEPLGSSLIVDLVHVIAGGVGLAVSRYPARARAFATIAGAGYLALGPIELLTMASDRGGVLVVRRDMVSTAMSMTDIAPVLCFVLGAALIMLRAFVDDLGAGRE